MSDPGRHHPHGHRADARPRERRRGRGLGPAERWSLNLCALGMGLTGLLYGWLKYFHQRAGEFGPEPYRLQGWSQHAHVLLGPLMVFTLGLVVKGHVLPAVRSGTPRGRATGLWTAGVLAPMVLSGYGAQVCVDPAWRAVLAWIHGPAALLFLVGYGIHLARGAAFGTRLRSRDGAEGDRRTRGGHGRE